MTLAQQIAYRTYFGRMHEAKSRAHHVVLDEALRHLRAGEPLQALELIEHHLHPATPDSDNPTIGDTP